MYAALRTNYTTLAGNFHDAAMLTTADASVYYLEGSVSYATKLREAQAA